MLKQVQHLIRGEFYYCLYGAISSQVKGFEYKKGGKKKSQLKSCDFNFVHNRNIYSITTIFLAERVPTLTK